MQLKTGWQGMSALLLQRPLNVTTTDNSRARTFYPFCVLLEWPS
jgi:hypothetical protein